MMGRLSNRPKKAPRDRGGSLRGKDGTPGWGARKARQMIELDQRQIVPIDGRTNAREPLWKPLPRAKRRAIIVHDLDLDHAPQA